MSTQKIFFSYSRADSPFALKLAKDLRESGADIWLDQLDIAPGSHWDAAVEKALNSAAYVLVILTPSSTQSTNVMDEVSFALESGKKIIPVLLEDCLAPFRLRRLQRIDFTTDYTTGFGQLITSLNLTPGNAVNTADTSGLNILAVASTPADPAKELLEKEKRDNIRWEEAFKVNTIASYKKYLHETPSGLFADEARLMIQQLEIEQREEEMEALLWQKAKNEHAKNLYQHYLQEYPQGNYKTLALAALAEFEKAEKEEARRLNEIAIQQEKERAQKAKEEKEKADQLERERVQKVKEEKEKADQLERERLQKIKEEKEKADQLERERLQKIKEEKENQLRLDREKVRREKEEKEKQLQLEKEIAQHAKLERDKQLALEKEIAQKAKQEREKQLRLEKEKAQREKEEREKQLRLERETAQREKEEKEKQLRLEKEKAQLAKKQEKEKAERERIAAGGSPIPPGNNRKYIMIGAGILVMCLGIWWITSKGSGNPDRESWNEALQKNDSTAFAQYMEKYPSGKYYTIAKERIDSLYWVQQEMRDSLAAIEAAIAVANPSPKKTTEPPAVVKTEPASIPAPAPKPIPAVKPKANPQAKSKPSASGGTKAATPPAKFTLGQEFAGGIVISVNAKGDGGMIVSSKDLGRVSWDKAKKILSTPNLGSYSGWALPSKAELELIYKNRQYLGEYSKDNYWSATEEGKNSNSAWIQNFSNGNQSKASKQSVNVVRAVKPF